MSINTIHVYNFHIQWLPWNQSLEKPIMYDITQLIIIAFNEKMLMMSFRNNM